MWKKCLRAAVVVSAVLAASACSKKDDAGATADTAATAGTAVTADTSMAGMDHSKMAKRELPPAKDADHDFLRSMVDHHEGLIWITDQAQKKGTAATAREDALRLYSAQISARDAMLKIITSAYGETHKAEPMPRDVEQNNRLAATPAAGFDKKFYQTLVEHHREGLAMINSALPKLTRADVKSMAEKMKAEHENEIKGFESKAGA